MPNLDRYLPQLDNIPLQSLIQTPEYINELVVAASKIRDMGERCENFLFGSFCN
jgi:hypothetical protein